MAESGIPVPSRRTLLACTGAACAAVLAGCGRGSASSGGMAAGQSAQAGSTATVPAGWDSGAVAALGASPAQGRSQPPAQAEGQSPAPSRSESPAPDQSQAESQPPAPAQVPALAATSDVPVGGGMILSAKKIVITQPQAGSFKAFTAICTHQGCTVSTVSGGTINCPCHGSKFNITNGSVVNGPAASPLAAVNIKVQGTSIVQA